MAGDKVRLRIDTLNRLREEGWSYDRIGEKYDLSGGTIKRAIEGGENVTVTRRPKKASVKKVAKSINKSLGKANADSLELQDALVKMVKRLRQRGDVSKVEIDLDNNEARVYPRSSPLVVKVGD